MDCGEARLHLIDLRRRRLAPALHAEVDRHLESCADCRSALEVEGSLDELLRRSLPRRSAPPALRARLAERIAAATEAPSGPPRARWRRAVSPMLAACLALALVGVLVERHAGEAARAEAALTEELVNDHLRVLASQRPAEIESGGPHQVKPWFEGRLDFAPVVPAPAGPDLQLRGGAVGYVLDQRAAVLQYTLRLHRLTLLVVRAEGLPWAPGSTGVRGFQVVRWRSGELGYALVADVSPGELATVADSFKAVTGR